MSDESSRREDDLGHTDVRREQQPDRIRAAAADPRDEVSAAEGDEGPLAHDSVAANRDAIDGLAERARALRDETQRLRERVRRRRTDVEEQG